MSIFIGQLVGFALIAFVIWRYVVPLVREMMHKQQSAVRDQITEAKAAAERRAEAERAHDNAVEQARVEAAKIREDSRADAQRITEQLQLQADAEANRIRQQSTEQAGLQRQQAVRQLRTDLGTAAAEQAQEKVRSRLAEPDEKSRTVERVLDGLEAMAAKEKDDPNANKGAL